MSYAGGTERDINTSILETAALSTADEALRTFFFPPEMIGGSCPLVKGEEESIAWNAAAEACASERIHFVWRVHADRVWYLALRSEDMASRSKTWCPFASLLPGAPDAFEAPVIYTFYSDEAATLMAVDREGLQIIRGTSSVVKAKAERMARETGVVDIVELIPDRIVALRPVMWESLSLLENRARRFMGFAAVLSAVAVIALSIFVWFMASVTQLAYRSDLKELQGRTAQSLMELQQTAMILRTSDMREQISNFNILNENLIGANGWLKLYLMKDTVVKWWGVVPQNLTSDRIQEFGGQTIETTDEGLVVAKSKDSYLRKGQIK